MSEGMATPGSRSKGKQPRTLTTLKHLSPGKGKGTPAASQPGVGGGKPGGGARGLNDTMDLRALQDFRRMAADEQGGAAAADPGNAALPPGTPSGKQVDVQWRAQRKPPPRWSEDGTGNGESPEGPGHAPQPEPDPDPSGSHGHGAGHGGGGRGSAGGGADAGTDAPPSVASPGATSTAVKAAPTGLGRSLLRSKPPSGSDSATGKRVTFYSGEHKCISAIWSYDPSRPISFMPHADHDDDDDDYDQQLHLSQAPDNKTTRTRLSFLKNRSKPPPPPPPHLRSPPPPPQSTGGKTPLSPTGGSAKERKVASKAAAKEARRLAKESKNAQRETIALIRAVSNSTKDEAAKRSKKSKLARKEAARSQKDLQSIASIFAGLK